MAWVTQDRLGTRMGYFCWSAFSFVIVTDGSRFEGLKVADPFPEIEISIESGYNEFSPFRYVHHSDALKMGLASWRVQRYDDPLWSGARAVFFSVD